MRSPGDPPIILRIFFYVCLFMLGFITLSYFLHEQQKVQREEAYSIYEAPAPPRP
jgi:hypothetical protein